jgi:HEAT repeat protein
MVRRTCVNLLDQLVDEESLPDLVAALDDPDPTVCARALHALACEQCKQNECRPGDDLFVPKALEFVRSHADPDIRAAAIGALGRIAYRRRDVADALLVAAERDPNPDVRNIARLRTRRLAAQTSGQG